jgi:peptide-methionine (R)-S-oxide reductase
VSPRHRRRRLDPIGRQIALAIGAARIAIGAGALSAPRAALGALGYERPGASALTLARLAGARDVALGALAIAGRDDPGALRAACLAGAGADAADVAVFGKALAGGQEDPLAGVTGVATALPAALIGLWAASRL